MTFLQFFWYFLVSKVIIDLTLIGIVLLRQRILKRQFENAIKSGAIKFASQEELAEIMETLNGQDKKSWN